jgi:4-amino-4-deoxy-L-arabinose transferase-like glycosyltransferase
VRGFPVVLGLGLFWILTHGVVTFTTDSVFYWSASRTLLEEHELSTGVVYTNTPLEPGLLEGHPQALHPLTVFAPGYSVATAIVARATDTSIVSATLLVNLLSGAAIILLAGTLARRAAGERAGCVAAAFVAALPFFQTTLATAGSELLFVALMLLALQLMIEWTDAPERGALKLYMATLAIAAATYTRYIGVSLYLVQVVVVAQHLLRSRPTGGRRLRGAQRPRRRDRIQDGALESRSPKGLFSKGLFSWCVTLTLSEPIHGSWTQREIRHPAQRS